MTKQKDDECVDECMDCGAELTGDEDFPDVCMQCDNLLEDFEFDD